MKNTSIEINKKCKIEKQALLLSKKLNKRIENEKLKYLTLIQNNIEKVKNHYDKKLEKRIKKITSEYNERRKVEKFKILGKERKKKENSSKWKRKSLDEFQLYTKLCRSEKKDGKIMILIVDKMIEVELTRKVNAGHCYPQRNYPQLAFDIRNVRPISNWENKKQADTIGNWVVNIPKETQKYLKKKSEDKENKEEKNKLRDVNYFIDMYNLYHEKNKKEKERLGIN